MANDTKQTGRESRLKSWHWLIISIVFHAVLVVLLSPSLFTGGQDNSPEALLERAREHVAEKRYQQALELYQKVVQQKPSLPAVFVDAENELNQIRLKALEQQRKEAEKARLATEKAEQEAEGDDDDDDDADAAADGGTRTPPDGDGAGEPDAAPDVDLPELPNIGDF